MGIPRETTRRRRSKVKSSKFSAKESWRTNEVSTFLKVVSSGFSSPSAPYMTFDLVDIALSKRISNAKLQGWNEFPMMKMHFHFGFAAASKSEFRLQAIFGQLEKMEILLLLSLLPKKFDHISSALCLAWRHYMNTFWGLTLPAGENLVSLLRYSAAGAASMQCRNGAATGYRAAIVTSYYKLLLRNNL